jgi:hypothetical protein
MLKGEVLVEEEVIDKSRFFYNWKCGCNLIEGDEPLMDTYRLEYGDRCPKQVAFKYQKPRDHNFIARCQYHRRTRITSNQSTKIILTYDEYQVAQVLEETHNKIVLILTPEEYRKIYFLDNLRITGKANF